MAQLPNLKFDKNRKFLTEQLEIQKAKVDNITDIISNIKSISQSKTCNVNYLNDLLDTGTELITEINANIASIESLFANLEEITNALSTILSPENQKGKTKSYYIDSFTKLEKDVTDYSKNFSTIMKKIENDNTTYDTFIASCNLNSSTDSSFSSNPSQIRQILEKNLVDQDNTFASIADSYNAENNITPVNVEDDVNEEGNDEEIINTENNDTEEVSDSVIKDVVDETTDTTIEEATTTDEDVVTDPTTEEATTTNEDVVDTIDTTDTTDSQDSNVEVENITDEISAEDIALLADEDILNEVEIDMVEDVLADSDEETDTNTDTDADDTTSDTIFKEDISDISDEIVDVPVIESFIDEDMELPDIEIKDEDFADGDLIDDYEIIESISLSDDLQEIIDDVNNSNETEPDTITAISEGFEGLMNASTSYTIDALKKSNRDFYDSLKNLSFEYEDYSTPISQLGKTSSHASSASPVEKEVKIEGTPRKAVKETSSENKSILENVISNRVAETVTEETTNNDFDVPSSTDTIVLDTSDIRKFTNVLNNDTTTVTDDVSDEENTTIENDDGSAIISDDDSKTDDEESLFNIQDEIIPSLDEVEVLADALNNSDNVTITMQDKDSDEEAIVKGNVNDTTTPRTNSLSKDKIEKVIRAEADNETLIISEKNNKIYLPYKMSEIKNYMHSYPDSYTDASDVVKQEFILDLSEFMQHPSKTRFQETYTLIRNRDGKSVATAVLYGLKLVKKSNLSPAVIAACKHKEELDRYLNCLKENKLDEFKSFNIMYEINPHK